MVVACEALKPSGSQFEGHNIYHVVEALLGKVYAERLRREPEFRSQDIRSAHLHRGEFHGSEFVQAAITSSYYDPTFTQARDELALITRAAIVEWLGRCGTFTMSPFQRKTSLWRRVKANALIVLPVIMILGIAVGLILDRLLRAFLLAPLAFLSPRIIAAIVNGTASPASPRPYPIRGLSRRRRLDSHCSTGD
jgi:hypothetical protein